MDWSAFSSLASIGLSFGLVVGLLALCIRFVYSRTNSIIKQSIRIN